MTRRIQPYGNTAQSAFGISFFLRYTKYICEKVPLSEPKFSQDLLLPNYAVLPCWLHACSVSSRTSSRASTARMIGRVIFAPPRIARPEPA